MRQKSYKNPVLPKTSKLTVWGKVELFVSNFSKFCYEFIEFAPQADCVKRTRLIIVFLCALPPAFTLIPRKRSPK